jgi:histidine ammonia-lyase
MAAVTRAPPVQDLLDGQTAYGINTGFGELSHVRIDRADVAQLQVNLVRSHSVGVGQPLPLDVVRGMMLLRADSLSRGHSGVRPEVVERLVALLNARITPVVPEQGSVGASGDLAPLAHRLHADRRGGRSAGRAARRPRRWRRRPGPARARAKEGLALINAGHDGHRALAWCDATACTRRPRRGAVSRGYAGLLPFRRALPRRGRIGRGEVAQHLGRSRLSGINDSP